MGVMKHFSSSSNDCGCGDYEEFKPSPELDNYTIQKWTSMFGNLVVMIKYDDVPNYEGMKILVYKSCTIADLRRQELIDPHFAENKTLRSPIARFEPTHEGWGLAIKCARDL